MPNEIVDTGTLAFLAAAEASASERPVVVDPSHSVGKASYVPAAALAAVAYGADGLCLEAHVSPNHGIGDDPKQALTPEVLRQTIRQARQLWDLRRS